MIFISIFNFLEPCVTIIAQAIPMFRVLFVNSSAKRGTNESSSKPYYISSPISQELRGVSAAVAAEPISMLSSDIWDGRARARDNEGLNWGHTRLGERNAHNMI